MAEVMSSFLRLHDCFICLKKSLVNKAYQSPEAMIFSSPDSGNG
jgi:hypothetical protein